MQIYSESYYYNKTYATQVNLELAVKWRMNLNF